jgi:osmoprotectant transport system substrate-binding protein
MRNLPVRRLVTGFALLGLALASAGCAGENPLSTGEDPSLRRATIGAQGFPESEIIAQIYGQVLEAAGYTVDYDLTIGARSVFIPDLIAGDLDLVPEYAGALLLTADSDASASSTQEVVAELADILEPLGLVVLDPAPAERPSALVVTARFAATHELVTIGDLAPLGPSLAIGAEPSFETERFGRAGLSEEYGVAGWSLHVPMSRAGLIADLVANVIQVAALPSSDTAIVANGLVVLEDPENLAPAQNIVPLVNSGIYSASLAQLLNSVSASLTTDDVMALNEAYAAVSNPTAADLAATWLAEKGFL